MLIRTQDRRSLVDMTGATINIDQYERELSTGTIYQYNIIVYSNTVKETLGRYSSYKKALKVLDMIQKTYESTTSQLSINGFLITQCNKVFEMPADEDIDKEE